MKLPGQQKHASKRLQSALREVQSRLGWPVVFLDISAHPHLKAGLPVQGYHDSQDDEERIWLDSNLPYSAQEATAAHELAHIIQRLDGFPEVYIVRKVRAGSPAAQEILTARINNLVLDEHADRWAIARGFRVDKALSASALPKLLASLKNSRGERFEKPDAFTQIMALDYAGLSLRLERFGMSRELDELWAERWPLSKAMGLKLAEIVRNSVLNNPDACRKVMLAIVGRLGISRTVIAVT